MARWTSVAMAPLVGVPAVLMVLVPVRFLTEYGIAPAALGVVAALTWSIVWGAAHAAANPRGRVGLVAGLAVAVVALPAISAAIGRVTYARFGLTVYGVIPVPVLDLRVGPTGVLWFRDKTHFVSREELEPQLGAGDEIVVGIGWRSAVQLDPAIDTARYPNLHIAPTPEAFRLFDELRARGLRPLLIAHSTC